MNRTVIIMGAVIAVLVLLLVFQLGKSSGSDVNVQDCERVEQSGWEFSTC